jgi:hypothetical protein
LKNEVEEKIKHPNGKEESKIYIKGKLLGKGAFATCYEFIIKETQQPIACKVIEKASLARPSHK